MGNSATVDLGLATPKGPPPGSVDPSTGDASAGTLTQVTATLQKRRLTGDLAKLPTLG